VIVPKDERVPGFSLYHSCHARLLFSIAVVMGFVFNLEVS
jgi:hypothetical protein